MKVWDTTAVRPEHIHALRNTYHMADCPGIRGRPCTCGCALLRELADILEPLCR